MADTKISALPASTTPLAGTEVLPIVQSTTTKKVSVADLTAGRAVGVGSLTSTGTVSAAGVIDSTGTVDRIPFYNSGKQLVTNAGLTFTASDGSGTAAVLVAAINNTGAAGNLALRSTKDNSNRSILDLKYNGVDIYSPSASTATKAIEIDTTQNVKVSVGNLVIGTSGKGIDFSATAGTGTSELLADYEEGTFTPTYVGSVTPGTVTYTTQLGRYVKIGSQVYVTIQLAWSAHSGSSGNATVGGLPYANGSVATPLSMVPFSLDAAVTTVQVCYVDAAGSTILMRQYALTGTTTISAAAVSNAGTLLISGSYTTT